jgi:WD40 repeat protein
METGLMDVWGQKKTGPTQMAISRDGKYLLTLAMANKDNVQVWDLGTKQKVHGIKTDIGTMHGHIAIADDSKTAAYVQLRPKGAVILFDLVTGNRIRTIDDDRIVSTSPQRMMFFTPGGTQIALGNKDQILIWETATGKLKASWSAPGVDCLTPFFANGTRIASSDRSGNVYIWDVSTGKPIKTLQSGSSSLAITPDERTLVAQGSGPVKFWDLPNGDLRKDFKEWTGTYQQVVTLAERSVAWPKNDGFIVCDLETGTKKQDIKTNEPYVTSLAVTPDGRTLLTAATDGLIKGWSVNAQGLVE